MTGGVGKTDVIICDMCRMPCEEEVFFGGHGLIEEVVIPLTFCTEDCRNDHSEINERIEVAVNERVRAEFKLLHDRVCPSCVRRLKKLL